MDHSSDSSETTTPTLYGWRIHPLVLALGCLLGGLILHLIGRGPRTVAAHQVIGMLLVAAGTGFSSYAAALFAARGTTRNPFGDPTSLVAIVPFTFTRNPMYCGITVTLIGFAVFFGSIVMLLAPIVFVIAVDRTVIRREELTMERSFGVQYLEYKARVRRWL